MEDRGLVHGAAFRFLEFDNPPPGQIFKPGENQSAGDLTTGGAVEAGGFKLHHDAHSLHRKRDRKLKRISGFRSFWHVLTMFLQCPNATLSSDEAVRESD